MLRKLTLLSTAMLLATQVYGHQVTSNYDLAAMAADANLVFQGKVVGIDYRGSQAGRNQRSIPHTFVTFEVEDVIYGRAPRRKFTVRFLGGPGERGNIMVSDYLPHFDIGDKDILFVSGNGVGECPLVNCADGRFRVIDGMVYNEYGQKLLQDREGRIFLGPTEQLEEVSTFRIGEREFRRRIIKQQVQEGDGEVTPELLQAPGYHLDLQSFLMALRTQLQNQLPQDPRGQGKVARHTDKTRPFSMAPATPVTLPEPQLEAAPEDPSVAQERRQVEARVKQRQAR